MLCKTLYPRNPILVAMTALGVATLAIKPGNTAAQQSPTWTISQSGEVVLGQGTDELFQFVRFGRLLDDGSAVVADAGGLFLRVYGPDGTRKAAMGKRGNGPGEFRAIYGLWLAPGGSIGVWDGDAHRLTMFDATGRLISTHLIQPDARTAAGNLEVFLGSFPNGDVLLATLKWQRPETSGSVPESWVLGRFGADGRSLAPAGEIRGMWRTRQAPLPFSPVPRFAMRADSIWLAEGYDAELKLLSPGGSVQRTIALPWNIRPSGDARKALKEKLQERKATMLLALLEEASRSEQFPRVGGMLADDRGYLWVKEYDPAVDAIWLKRNALDISPGGNWRILSPDGRWVAVVRMPANLIPLDIRGDKLLGVERDELDVERVVVRSVVRS